jgi:hypothetical protein
MAKLSDDATALVKWYKTIHESPGAYVLLTKVLPLFDDDKDRVTKAINELKKYDFAILAPNGGSFTVTGPAARYQL